MRTLLLIVSAMLASAAVSAANLVQQPSLTLEGARHVIAQAIAHARAHNAPGGAVAVVDAAGVLVGL